MLQTLQPGIWPCLLSQTVKSILQQCYGDKGAVTDELVADILQPGLLPGAAAVFLDFVTYSSGPLPEDLLAQARPLLHALVHSYMCCLPVRQLELQRVSQCACATEPQGEHVTAGGGRAGVHPVGREGPLGAHRAGPRVC